MKKLGCSWGVVILTASCSFPRPADVGPDDGSTTVTCQLTAISPSLANTDDLITLEGTFDDTVMVNFPGGISSKATVLGPHRATVTTPAAATAGDLSITACGATLGAFPFRRASFATGLGMFQAGFHQIDGAQQPVRLPTALDGHASVTLGHHVYLLGGSDRNGARTGVERARINADGSIGPFAALADVHLETARREHTATILGRYVYVVGGKSNNAPLSTIERAPIAPDGTLGPFSTIPTLTLTTARHGHRTVIIGQQLYVIGGFEASSLSSIERATIGPDDTLGGFTAVSEVALVTGRHGHTASITGNYLYIIGGIRGNNSLQSVERASIDADGSLGQFSIIPTGALVTPRSGHTATLLGNHLYVIGGMNSNGLQSSIERASLDTTGSLAPFEIASESALTIGRRGHSTEVIENYLYTFGGLDGELLDDIERSTINASGGLSTFDTVPDLVMTTERYFHTTSAIASQLYHLGPQPSIERTAVARDNSLAPFASGINLSLATPRSSATTAIVGNTVYIIGGSQGTTLLSTIEQAHIAHDDSLEQFAPFTGRTLTVSRTGHSATIVGNYLYIIGGSTELLGNPVSSIERAYINTDGALAAFETTPLALTTGRADHTSAVIGTYLYVFGGHNGGVLGNSLSSIERATIGKDGSLGPFTIVSDSALTAPRESHTIAIIGSSVYVFGGITRTPVSSDNIKYVEQATINNDGTLGPFTSLPATRLKTVRYGHTTVAIGNQVYLFGGGVGDIKAIERATLDFASPR